MLRYVPALAAVAALGASVPKAAKPSAGAATPERVAVLVELFTSEACTACPAAGEVLRTLEQQQPIAGVEVIGMEMRMDAWGPQGYRDPFALRAMTNRQNDYIRLFRLENLFTPQMVIGGQAQLPGSDAGQMRDEIVRAARNRIASVEVSFQSASLATVKVDKLPSSAGESEIWMAVTESAPGQTPVVRSLVMLGTAEPGGPTTYSMHLRFNPRWKREDLKYVVFVQERLSRKIWGATSVVP